MQHEELFCCHSAEWVKEVRKAVEATDNERKSECDRCAGNDGTDPVYHVIGKILIVRNISNKIIVLEKRGRY